MLESVLNELKNGKKKNHWMWYIFPQIQGLGNSEKSVFYAIADTSEAEAYIIHPILGERLVNCVEAVLSNSDATANDIFGSTDELKFHSCLTLFDFISSNTYVFSKGIDIFYNGQRHMKTLDIIEQ